MGVLGGQVRAGSGDPEPGPNLYLSQPNQILGRFEPGSSCRDSGSGRFGDAPLFVDTQCGTQSV